MQKEVSLRDLFLHVSFFGSHRDAISSVKIIWIHMDLVV